MTLIVTLTKDALVCQSNTYLYLHLCLLILFIISKESTHNIMTFWPVTLTFNVTLQILALHWNATYYPVVFYSWNYMSLEKNAKFDLYDLWPWLKFDLAERCPVFYCITVLSFTAVEWPILLIYCIQIVKHCFVAQKHLSNVIDEATQLKMNNKLSKLYHLIMLNSDLLFTIGLITHRFLVD
jgi:hypothetical protein